VQRLTTSAAMASTFNMRSGASSTKFGIPSSKKLFVRRANRRDRRPLRVTGTGSFGLKTLHRIEESTLREEVEAAGFHLVAEGNFGRNSDDTHDFPSYKPVCRSIISSSSFRSHSSPDVTKWRF
jgi:hypothetical protein